MGGLWVPASDAGACNQWVFEGCKRGLLSEMPAVGAAVIYTAHQKIVGGRYDGQLHAVHMGVVFDVTKQLTAIEGNTSMSTFEHDGWIQALKVIDAARVLCCVRAVAAQVVADAA